MAPNTIVIVNDSMNWLMAIGLGFSVLAVVTVGGWFLFEVTAAVLNIAKKVWKD